MSGMNQNLLSLIPALSATVIPRAGQRLKLAGLGLILANAAAASPLPTPESGVWPETELNNLTVCWEQPGYLEEKLWVEDVIAREYGDKTKLRFTGWTDCSVTPAAHIRVGIFDFQTHTKGLGSEIDGQHYGVVLNFTFNNWNRPCQHTLEACIEGLAVHEFGHVAGLPDTLIPFHGDPATCIGKSIDHLATAALSLDDSSIMNYCNTAWQAAELDSDDAAAVAKLYP